MAIKAESLDKLTELTKKAVSAGAVDLVLDVDMNRLPSKVVPSLPNCAVRPQRDLTGPWGIR